MSGKPGDHLIELKIKLPSNLSKRHLEIFEELQKLEIE